jgi:hypothetical protein
MFVLCVLYNKGKRQSQFNQEKEVQTKKRDRIKQNAGGGDFFLTLADLPLGPTQPPVQWVPGFFLGGKAAGAWS